MAAPKIRVLTSGEAKAKHRSRQRAIERGDLVSNAPLRARCEWLLEHDPEFTMSVVCERMVEQGFPKFVKRDGRSQWNTGDTSYLLRVLGMRERASSVKHGHRYAGGLTEWIPYDLAVALARSLDMWPVDAGV